jgi:hypothetical protein
MTESLPLALIAVACACVLSRLAPTGAIMWVVSVLPVDPGDVPLAVPAAN